MFSYIVVVTRAANAHDEHVDVMLKIVMVVVIMAYVVKIMMVNVEKMMTKSDA